MTRAVPLFRREGNGRWGKDIPLGIDALVDDEDYDRVMAFHAAWRLHGEGYACSTKNRRVILMHRLILGLEDPDIHTDHKDRDRLNNQKHNIVACTQAENNTNLPFVGVGRFRDQWRAWGRQLNGAKHRHLGVFDTREEALAAVTRWTETQERDVVDRLDPEARLSPCCNAAVVRNGFYRGTRRFRCKQCRWTFKETEWQAER